MDTATHPTGAEHFDRGAIGPYRLRGLRYARSGTDQDSWRATLMRDGRRIGRLTSQRREGPVAAIFLLPVDRALTVAFAQQWADTQSTPDENEPRNEEIDLQDLLLALAEGAYHLRQLQVQSRVHTLFRLVGDPVDQFRTLRNAPYTPAREGMLHLMYGQRLVEIIRTDSEVPGLAPVPLLTASR